MIYSVKLKDTIQKVKALNAEDALRKFLKQNDSRYGNSHIVILKPKQNCLLESLIYSYDLNDVDDVIIRQE